MSNTVNNNQLNYVIYNKRNLDCNSSIYNYYIKYPQPVVIFDLKKLKKLHATYYDDLKYPQDGGYSDSTIKGKHIKLSKSNMHPNKL